MRCGDPLFFFFHAHHAILVGSGGRPETKQQIFLTTKLNTDEDVQQFSKKQTVQGTQTYRFKCNGES